MDLLHGIKPGDPKKLVNVIIEIPIGSTIKYEYHPDVGVIVADRFLHTAMTYPFNYGFIPQTWSEDEDAIDIVVLSSQPIVTGTLVQCRIIGMLATEDEEGEDAKLLAFPNAKVDPDYAEISSIEQLNNHTKEKIKHFYMHYKELEGGKWVKVTDWVSKEGAQKKVQEAIDKYKKHFAKK